MSLLLSATGTLAVSDLPLIDSLLSSSSPPRPSHLSTIQRAYLPYFPYFPCPALPSLQVITPAGLAGALAPRLLIPTESIIQKTGLTCRTLDGELPVALTSTDSPGRSTRVLTNTVSGSEAGAHR